MRIALAVALVAAAVVAAVAFAGGSGSGSGSTTEWQALTPSPLSRTEVAAARVGRFVYVVGGFEERSGQTTSAVVRYDLERDSWKRVRSLPIGVNHTGIAASGGRVYVMGGYTEPRDFSRRTAALFRYDPSRDRWKRLRSAPTQRAAHTMQAISGRLYAVGGVDDGGATTRLEVYDIERNRWSAGPAMTKAREHLASAVARGRLHVLAGRTGDGGNFTTHEAYNPRTRRWSTLPDMRKARGGIAGAAVDSGRIVVFGGEEAAGTIREVEVYDVAARRWSALPDMRTPRHGLGGIAYRGRVYAIEGGPQPGFFFSNVIEVLRIP
jgi:N-acetylneuraminic acid mutarotase